MIELSCVCVFIVSGELSWVCVFIVSGDRTILGMCVFLSPDTINTHTQDSYDTINTHTQDSSIS
jgi:hypothetical protein